MAKNCNSKNSPYYFKWYGFDLDGTIADNSLHSSGMGTIGKPIKPMIRLMKKLHKEGHPIRIVTARVGDVGCSAIAFDRLKEHIGEWCDKHLGFRPEVTDRKDAMMEALYDDRVKQVVPNKGITYDELVSELADCLRLSLASHNGRFRDDKLLARCDKVLRVCNAL